MTIQLYFSPARSGFLTICVLPTHHILFYICVLTFLTEAVQYLVPHVNQDVIFSVGNQWKMKGKKKFFFFSILVYS